MRHTGLAAGQCINQCQPISRRRNQTNMMYALSIISVVTAGLTAQQSINRRLWLTDSRAFAQSNLLTIMLSLFNFYAAG
jgi:hypothetical protein